MPVIQLFSKKFPGISLICPQIPGTDPPQSGSHYFTVGYSYEVTDETKAAIEKQFAGFPPAVSSEISIHVESGLTAATVAIAPPPPATQSNNTEDKTNPSEAGESQDDEPNVDDVLDLSEEDEELIEVEVSKLLGKTVAEAEPQLIQTGGNPELPKKLRTVYLDQVIQNSKIQKSLREIAAKLKEQL